MYINRYHSIFMVILFNIDLASNPSGAIYSTKHNEFKKTNIDLGYPGKAILPNNQYDNISSNGRFGSSLIQSNSHNSNYHNYPQNKGTLDIPLGTSNKNNDAYTNPYQINSMTFFKF